MRKVLLVVLSLLNLNVYIMVGAAPICSHGQTGCHELSLADLFERVIQQSSRMHAISSDLHSEGQFLFPSKNQIGKQKCHTYGIMTPEDKENAQRLRRDELMEVILRLLEAWESPVSQLHRSMAQDRHQDFEHDSSNKALEMNHMVQELRNGVAKVAEKMKLMGVISNAVGDIASPPSAASLYERAALRSVYHHDLLYCFRRDSNKVQNYLRILKCTILPELDC